jgi:hypothetical protein
VIKTDTVVEDGANITWEGLSRGEIKISRLKVSGSNITVAGATHFRIGRGATQSWEGSGWYWVPGRWC